MMPRRGDCLYTRGPGRRYYFKAKIDGIWREFATRTRNYADARTIRGKFLTDLEQGRKPSDRSRWTLRQAVEQRLVERRHRIAPGSFASEATIVRTLLRVLGSETRLQKLADIETVRKYETVRLSEGIAAKSVNNEIVVLAGILRDARLWRFVETEYKRLQEKKSDIPDALTKDEGHRMLREANLCNPDAVAPLAAVLAFATGMRTKEIKQLQLGSIYLEVPRPYLHVKRGTTKTNKGARFVALDTVACWALRKLMERPRTLGATQPNHYLLPTRLDRHTRATDPLKGSGCDPTHSQTSWEAEWNSFRKRAQIEHRRFHDLRHTFITRAAESGVPLIVIQAQVGHMSKAMIEHYCHISEASVHEAAKLMEERNPDLPRQLGLLEEDRQLRSSISANKKVDLVGMVLSCDDQAGVVQ